MPKPRKDQKSTAQQYAGNLRYFNRPHLLRRARLLSLIVGAVVCLAAGAIYLMYWQHPPVPPATASSGKPAEIPAVKGEWFNSAGGISQAHSMIAQRCEACHDPKKEKTIVQMCEGCHNTPPYNFHQTNVTEAVPSCTECHHEHLGTGPMQPVADSSCVSCHGNASLMSQSAQIGHGSPATMGPFRKDPQLTYFCPAVQNSANEIVQPVQFRPLRPPGGYTQVITSFDQDHHPDFQIQRENLRDPDTLMFNHKFHLGAQVRRADGSALTCEECHKADSTGAYMQPISYQKNCQECHKLQMDVALPDFLVPHPAADDPNSNSVRNFLKDLAPQYRNYAIQNLKMTSESQIGAFVNKSMTRVQERYRQGDDLDADVFGAGLHTIYYGGAQPKQTPDRAPFQGCALCHEVQGPSSANLEAKVNHWVVSVPRLPDRWYVHAKFNHAAHATVASCEECHAQARTSEKTADVLLPDRESCLKCHNPTSDVASNCSTCHDYHNEAPTRETAGLTPLRKMMLGAVPLVRSAGPP